MHDVELDFCRKDEWPNQRVQRPVSTRVDSKCDAKDATCPAGCGLAMRGMIKFEEKLSKTREVDERKKSINNIISQLKFCCRFCATSR